MAVGRAATKCMAMETRDKQAREERAGSQKHTHDAHTHTHMMMRACMCGYNAGRS